ncbi:MAG: hypothetical protein ABJG55_06850 [Paracoccaceae bacterium]
MLDSSGESLTGFVQQSPAREKMEYGRGETIKEPEISALKVALKTALFKKNRLQVH